MSNRRLRVAVGSDLRHPLAEAVAARLESVGHAVIPCGAVHGTDTPWAEVGEQVGRLVAQGAADQGIVCCWTGTGVSIAANKVPGVRAALCGDAETARGARRWNDANVLALSLRATTEAVALEILDAWLSSDGIDPSETASIAQIDEIERRYRDRAGAATRA